MAVYTDEFIAKMRRFMELREERDTDAEAAKASEAKYRVMEAEVWDELAPAPEAEDKKLHAVKIPLGPPYGTVKFEPRETFYARIIPGSEDQLLEHYEQRQLVDEVSAPKFVMKRLNEDVRAALESAGTIKLPPGTDFYAKRAVAITRPK